MGSFPEPAFFSVDSTQDASKQPVFVIAEIGKNFITEEEERSVEVYLERAKALVLAAKESGADAVKFQTHNVEDEQADIEVIAPHFKGADRFRWVTRNTEATPDETFWKPLKRFCDEAGITFFSTPMSRGAARRLTALDVPFWKVGSADILDFVMLDHLRSSGKPIILSSGMSTLDEVDQVIAFLQEKTNALLLMHCVSQYPCPPEALRLKTIPFFRSRYNIPIGFSDHSLEIEPAIAAVALGAVAVEKHFSFDRAAWGSDHKVSLLPSEFRALVDGIRRVSADAAFREEILNRETVKRAMGTEEKLLDETEATFRPVFRKTLVASRNLAPGEIISSDDLSAMRPQMYLEGFPSEAYPLVLGKTVKVHITKGRPITEDHVE